MKPRRCNVQHCLSDTRRKEDEGVTFHRFPLHREIRDRWMILGRVDPAHYKRILYACSRHFLRVDFCHTKGKKYTLLPGIEPSIFSWSRKSSNQTAASTTPQRNATIAEGNGDDVAIDSNIADAKLNMDVEDSVAATENDAPADHADASDEIKTEENSQEVSTTKSEEELSSSSTVAKKMNLEHFKSEEMSSVSTVEQKPKSIITPTGTIIFLPDMKIEALDCQQNWSPATIVEIDCDEDEVLVHFDEYSSKHDEWLSMSSAAIRAPKTTNEYEVGERCLACWSDCRKFPAKVINIVDKDTCEVEFDDGYKKTVNTKRMSKPVPSQGESQGSSLFDPVKGSKQERRDKKRKINVTELFGKRSRSVVAGAQSGQATDGAADRQSVSVAVADDVTTVVAGIKPGMTGKEDWIIKWNGSVPVGEDTTLQFEDGVKSTIRVPDSRLPDNWQKHFARRPTTGKWEILIVNPDGVKFRSLKEIRTFYIDLNELPKPLNRYDFTHMRPMQKSVKAKVGPVQKRAPSISAPVAADGALESPIINETPPEPEIKSPEQTSPTHTSAPASPQLKILHVDDAYRCPIYGCAKNFRRENLAQMHIKHYHPDQFKLLDGVATPNVADLAYARTVTDSLEASIDNTPVLSNRVNKTAEGRAPTAVGATAAVTPARQKDAEIIRLLMNKHPTDCADQSNSVHGNSASQDIRLKDLLHSSNSTTTITNTTCPSTSTPTTAVAQPLSGRPAGSGIRTLLPVVREEKANDGESVRRGRPAKRKRESVDGTAANWSAHAAKDNSTFYAEYGDGSQSSQEFGGNVRAHSATALSGGPSDSDIIIEGGQIIRLVRMKQEEIINCACNYTEEDGLMIQCEVCLCWQHATCFNIYTETQVPDNYICHICRHPARMRPSRSWYYDQEWLKHGRLPTGKYRAVDSAFQTKRTDQLRRSHDLSGGLLELRNFMRSLKLKIKISENKNHPKLYLWSKPWPKNFLPEKANIAAKAKSDESSSMLFNLLKNAKSEQLISQQKHKHGMPTPEAAIENSDCRLNLLEHIDHCQNLVEERLDDFARCIDNIENDKGMFTTENDVENCRISETMQMLMRDLENLNDLSQVTTF